MRAMLAAEDRHAQRAEAVDLVIEREPEEAAVGAQMDEPVVARVDRLPLGVGVGAVERVVW